MPLGRNPAPLSLTVICLVVFRLVVANVCELGTEPDPADGGKIKLVLPSVDPCTCTEVRLGGHNPYAPQRPGGDLYIDIQHLKDILTHGLGSLFHCAGGKEDGTSPDKPKVSNHGVTLVAPKSTGRVNTDAQGSTAAASTQADKTTVISSTPKPMEPPADCQDILDAGQTTSGVYTIQHKGQHMTVYCRMESGKGYIVFQRRLDGSVSFDRTWQEYAKGFGNLTGEFSLGNDKLHSLASNRGWELVITLRAFDGDEARVRYGYFRINSYEYRVYISSFTEDSGEAGDSLDVHSDAMFSTRDDDNDWEGEENCADKYRGGWWYWDCHSGACWFQSKLNGLYYHSTAVVEHVQGIQWSTWKGEHVSLQGCEMMTRRSTSGPTDCQDILDAGQTTSGVYTIQHAGQNNTVYCRMESGKGYTVFQRRMDGSLSFDRTWQEYAEGFGNMTGEFWLGNEKLYALAGNWAFELVITLKAFGGDEARVRYKYFWIGSDDYKVWISSFSDESGEAADAGDALIDRSWTHFSARDDDHDEDDQENCAEKFHGGCWYKDCGRDGFMSNLNSLYYDDATVPEPMQGIQWATWKGNQVSLKGCEMMIRRKP